ncbi:hypothetical protein M0805_005864 [Coniferiporia weirii]|nr:hypothetical protein M0805_005864 [Coniferiporia weirii]
MSEANTSNATPSSGTAGSARKSIKRKIDDALHSLDEVLRPSDEPRRPVTKKARFPDSLYSTLAKYGIKSSKGNAVPSSKSDESAIIKKNAPHLSAILSRAATKKRKASHTEELACAKATNLSTTSLQTGASEYSPSSVTSFLSRLSSFKLSTYSNKPSAIDAVAASRAGWVNDGKDRLACGMCRSSWFVASRDGMTRDAANALLEKQKSNLTQMHKDGCPWKSRQCDSSIYRIPLKSPTAMSKQVRKHALELDNRDILEGVELRHPLTSSQVQGLMSSLASVRSFSRSTENLKDAADPGPGTVTTEAHLEPCQTAALIALFGWALVSSLSSNGSQTVTASLSRADSVAPVLSTPGSPRRTSWNSSVSEAGTPRPSRRPVSRISSAASVNLQRLDNQKERDSTLIYCSLCQRRIGLWTFKHSLIPVMSSTAISTAANGSDPGVTSRAAAATRRQSLLPKRQFDLLKEHRSYCPYAVRSTSVPSLSSVSYTSSTAQAPGPPSSGLSRSNSATSFNFSFTPRNAPAFPASSAGIPTDPSLVEGWRAVLTVVLRTGLSKRQRQRALMNVANSRPTSVAEGVTETETPEHDGEQNQTSDRMEVDGIQAMVKDVKTRGGKDLLRYVKSLFA